MEIPLTLKMRADGGVSYGIPLWYRVFSFALVAIVVGGLASSGSAPGVVAWIVLALLVLGFLYEENWRVDASAKQLRHRAGVYPFIRTTTIAFDEIDRFELTVLAKGTIPGLSEEAADRTKAYSMMRHTDGEDASNLKLFKSGRRKPYINLIVKTKNDDVYLIDTLPARRAARLPRAGKALAAACGSVFEENG